MIGLIFGLILGSFLGLVTIRLLKPLDKRLDYLEDQIMKLKILIKNHVHHHDGEDDPKR